MAHKGGCLCGKVRYEVDLTDADISNCHCGQCRRQTGAPFLTFAVVSINQFKWIGEPKGEISVSKKAIRYFCDNCGAYIRWLGKGDCSLIFDD